MWYQEYILSFCGCVHNTEGLEIDPPSVRLYVLYLALYVTIFETF